MESGLDYQGVGKIAKGSEHMKALRKKLHNSKGETLIEVLVSILICTLSVALLFSGIMAANNINRQAEISDNGFFDVLNAAEQKDDSSPYKTGKTVMVTEKGGTGARITFTVDYYGDDTIFSYKMSPQMTTGGDSEP